MTGLLQNGVYKDPFYGENLQQIPTEQFDVSWWYRTEFASSRMDSSFVRVTFHGINYKANVWFNGQLLGSSADIVGTFRYFDFDVTKYLNDTNYMAVEVQS